MKEEGYVYIRCDQCDHSEYVLKEDQLGWLTLGREFNPAFTEYDSEKRVSVVTIRDKMDFCSVKCLKAHIESLEPTAEQAEAFRANYVAAMKDSEEKPSLREVQTHVSHNLLKAASVQRGPAPHFDARNDFVHGHGPEQDEGEGHASYTDLTGRIKDGNGPNNPLLA